MARIGILVTRYATARNLENIIYQIGRSLSTEHQIDIIVIGEVSERIKNNFNIWKTTSIWLKIPVIGKILGRINILLQYIAKREPDLLMALSAVGINGLCVALSGRISGVPSVIRVTSDMNRVYKYKRPLRAAFRLWLKNNVFGRLAILISDTTVLLHKAQVDIMRRDGFRKSDFFVVSQPIAFPPLKNPDQARLKIRRKMEIPKDSRVIGYVGRLAQDKNLALLSDTLNIILEKDRTSYAIIVGDGPSKRFLERNLPEHRTIFVGAIPRDELGQYYMAMDFLLQTSYSEGLSNVLAEALYYRIPVVSTDSGAITRALISNIGLRPEELADFIIKDRVVLDPLPAEIGGDENRRLWLELINKVLKKNERKRRLANLF